MSIVEVKNLVFHFSPGEENDTAQGISFEVEKGEIFSVIGRNGSGKTTLARHLNALLIPPQGTVSVCGFDASDAKNTAEIRKKCGMVFSHSHDYFLKSVVRDEVSFALKCAGNEKKDIEDKTALWLRTVGMAGRENDALTSLTEYEALCVQTAAVLAAEPEILVFDDAAGPISGENREKYFSLLTKLREDGKTLILFTGHFDEAALAEKTLLLAEGRALACGKSREVLTDRTLLEKAGIELPFPLKVYCDLLDSDIRLPEPPLNMKELVDEICL